MTAILFGHPPFFLASPMCDGASAAIHAPRRRRFDPCSPQNEKVSDYGLHKSDKTHETDRWMATDGRREGDCIGDGYEFMEGISGSLVVVSVSME